MNMPRFTAEYALSEVPTAYRAQSVRYEKESR